MDSAVELQSSWVLRSCALRPFFRLLRNPSECSLVLGMFLKFTETVTPLTTQSSFLIGFGLTFAATAAPMLVTEISYPLYRAPLTSTYNSLWYSGAIVYVSSVSNSSA